MKENYVIWLDYAYISIVINPCTANPGYWQKYQFWSSREEPLMATILPDV